MGSLTSCLSKVGVSADDKRSILARARVLRGEGKSPAEAADIAVDEQIAAVRGLANAANDKPKEAAAPLYASRPVTNAADIIAWAASQGFKTTLPAKDMHVTVAYSRDPVDGTTMPPAAAGIEVTGGKRTVEPLGDEGAVVLKFTSARMQARWQAYRDAGASWDYDSYTPHITLTYDGKGVDLAKVRPYTGPIELGAEKQEPLNVDKADDYKEAGEAPTEKAEPAKGGKPATKIDDFGEKLTGARKDYAATLKDAEAVDIAAEPLSKSWPEPDYDKLLAGGADPFVVAFVHAARDEMPTKPQKSWKLKGWVEGVKSLRETSRSLLAGEVEPEKARKIAATGGQALKGVLSRAELYELVGHGRSLKGVSFSENHYTLYKGQQNVRKWVVEQKAKATAFSNWPRELAVADTKQAMLDQFAAKFMAQEGGDDGTKAPAKGQFVIYRKRGQEGAFIGKKIGREYIDLHKAADVAAAREYLSNSTAALENALEKYRETPFERKTENAPRVGDDHRNGAPVTPEVFADTFGFRGVQFGNYVEQGRRQSDLNEAYDGLMDLAAVLGLPPRALSLNGRLGLAFGARGRGGKNAPAAHYEPDNVVINLTKGGGPGSLAHELWHGMDNYFAANSGSKSGFITGGSKTDGMRDALKVAFDHVKTATQLPTLRKRAAELDKRKSKPYWNTPIELSARAFESYVIAKLQDQGAANDYLANVVDEKVWNIGEEARAEFITGGQPAETYPYPLQAELPAVRAAFDDFFKTVETRPDDAGNVAMFSRVPSTQAASGLQLPGTALQNKPETKRILTQENLAGGEGENTTADLRAALAKEFGADTIKALEDSGLLYLFDNHGTLFPRGTAGAAVGGRISLFAENGASVSTAYHEALHATLRKTIGDEAFDALMARMPDLVAQNSKFFAAAEKRIPADTPASVRNEELASYAVEEFQTARASMPVGVRRWVSELIAALKTGLAKALKVAGVGEKLRIKLFLDVAVLHKLARDGLKAMARGAESGSGDADIRFSVSKPANEGWSMPEGGRLDDFAYRFQDSKIDLKRAISAIKAEEIAVEDQVDAYLQETLFHGRAAKRVQDFAYHELAPLEKDMRARQVTVDRLDEYLHARHAKEANEHIAKINPDLPDGGSGMKTADAEKFLAELDPAEKKRLEAIASKVDAIIAKTRQTYVDYQLESQEVVDGWGEMFKSYVPLMREDKDGGMGIGQGFSIKGKEVKSRTGSTRKVVDILANIAMQRERAIVRGEKNRVATAMAGLVKLNPNPDVWKVGRVPVDKIENDEGEVVAQQRQEFKSKPNVLMVKYLGKDKKIHERAIVFNEENERAVRMVAALKNLDAANMEGATAIAAVATRWFASVNTQYNPVFGVVNLVRDVQGALLNLGSTELKGKRAAILSHTMPALRGVYSDARAARKDKGTDSEWSDLWEEFQNEGGATGFRDLFKTSADRANALKSAIDPSSWMDEGAGKFFSAGGTLKVPYSVAYKGVKPVFDWLSDYNLAMENAIRLSAYKVGLEQGMTKQRAAELAKNLTVNFNRKGAIAPQVGAWYAFFNASMQGTARMGEVLFDLKDGKLELSKTGKTVIAGGLALGVVQAVALAAAGFDDDDIPEFVKERNLIFPIGGKKYLTLPMPLGWHVIPNLGRIATELAMKGGKDWQKKMVGVAGLIFEAFNPIGSSGVSWQTLMPTVADPFIALTENKDWTGRPIARESFNKNTPGFKRARDTASGPAKFISEAMNKLSGGTDHVRGAFSPTPDQIDFLWSQLTGGVGRELSKFEQSIAAGFSGEDLPPHKIPLVGRFYGNGDAATNQASRFYENLKTIERHETEIKGLKGSNRSAEIAPYMQENPSARLWRQANLSEKRVQELRKKKRALLEADAPRAQVKEIEDRIAAEMTRFNATVEATVATP